MLYNILLETQACEVSQRIIAMDNASTNAGEMVGRFTLFYNRYAVHIVMACGVCVMCV